MPRLAEALVSRDWDVRVVTLSDAVDQGMPGDPRWSVKRVDRRQPFLWRTAALTAAIAREARSADVIFVAGMLTEAAAANLRARKPMVAKIVGDEVWDRASRRGWTSLSLDAFQTARGGLRVRGARAIREWALGQVSLVVAPSRYTADLVRGWRRRPPPLAVIYNAAPPIAADSEADPLPGVPRPRVVMAGRLIALKRVDGMIRLLRELPGAALVLVGSGECEGELRALAAAEGVQDRVHFVGSVTQPRLLAILAAADLLVLNSTTENCPHVILEAMASGLPVVATRVGGVPELVEDGVTGWLVDADDPAAMRSRIASALADAHWRQRAALATRQAAHRFNWSNHADEIDRTLRGLMART